MKLNKMFLGGLVALGLLASCKGKEPSGQTETLGSTYMSINVNLGESLRAEEGDYNSMGDWEGRDKINAVDVFVLSEGENKVQHFTQATAKTQPTIGQDGVYSLTPWKTTPGNKIVYVVVNGTEEVINKLKAATPTNFATEYAMVLTDFAGNGVAEKYAKTETFGSDKKDIITMTGAPASIAVVDGVTQEQAKNGQNTAKISVRRIAALVATTVNKSVQEEGFKIKKGEGASQRVVGSLKDVKWTVAQFEKTAKLYEAEISHKKIKSPNWEYVTSDNNAYNNGTDGAKDKYDYSLLKQGFDLAPFERKSNNNPENVKALVDGATMKFISETTHAFTESQTDETKYRRGNTPYIMVTATFVPETSEMATGEVYQAEKDIHYGTVDGKFYMDENKAKENNKIAADSATKKDGVITFKKGKMYYFAWLNPDTTAPTTWRHSPVVRNNFYHVNVAGFNKLGFSGNPYNPTTPPGGGGEDEPDPDDPTPDPKDPITDKETYMTTEITVINWGVHSYDVNF
ncbi:MAG: Mfa1 family fimbria major subunit [Porphyromonas sp.]|nr:Mfa1 family fimbria major subunit [Porphyromonas sp.]